MRMLWVLWHTLRDDEHEFQQTYTQVNQHSNGKWTLYTLKITPDISKMMYRGGTAAVLASRSCNGYMDPSPEILVVHEIDAVSGRCVFLVDASEISGVHQLNSW